MKRKELYISPEIEFNAVSIAADIMSASGYDDTVISNVDWLYMNDNELEDALKNY